jgi:hypothetical protein
MFDHELNPVKGWPSPYAVDKAAEPADGVTWNGGMIMSLDANGDLVLGVGNTDMGIAMLQNSTDPDVAQDHGGISGGVGSGLVCGYNYEVESTEFVAAQYAPGDLLTSTQAPDPNAGLLQASTYPLDCVVGVVSDGTFTNDHNVDVLRFWTQYLPVHTH